MSPSDLSWWVWLLPAIAFWLLQLIASAYRYNGTVGARFLRGVLLAGMVFSAFVAVIRFVEWAWGG